MGYSLTLLGIVICHLTTPCGGSTILGYSYYHDLDLQRFSLADLVSSARGPNGGVVKVTPQAGDDDEVFYRICPVTSLLPYTIFSSATSKVDSVSGEFEVSDDSKPLHRPGVISDTASILLAKHIWNTRKAPALDCNVRFTSRFFDTQTSPIRTTAYLSSEFRDVDRRPCAVLGPFTSTATTPTAILSSVYETPQLGYGMAASVDLSNDEQYPYYHRMIGSTDTEAIAVLNYILTFLDKTKEDIHHFGLIHSTDSNGNSFAKSITDLIASSPDGSKTSSSQMVIEKVAISFDSYEGDEDISKAISRLKSTGYKYIMTAVREEQFIPVIREALRQGLAGNNEILWFIADMDYRYLEDQFSRAPDGVELSKASQGAAVFQWTASSSSSGYVAFKQAYHNAMRDPEFLNFVFSNVPQDVMSSLPSKDALLNQLIDESPTVFGYSLHDAILSLGMAACSTKSVNGTSPESYLFTGPDVTKALNNITISDGASGPVSFDPITRTRLQNTYAVYNIAASGRGIMKIQLSAEYSESYERWNVKSPFVYPGYTYKVPPSLPPIDYNPHYIGKAARITGIVLCGLIIVLALLCSFWVVYQRLRTPVIQASGEFFLHSTVLGCIIMATSIIPLSLDESVVESTDVLDSACQATPWLYYIGLAIIYSGMLMKTWLLYQIKRKHNKGITSGEDMINVTPMRLVGSFALCFSATFVVLLVQDLLAPLEWERISMLIFDQYNRSLQSYGTCSSSNSSLEDATKAIIFVWNTCLLFTGNVLAYLSRSIRTEYKENHYIGLILASIMQSLFISFPIMIVVRTSPPARFWVNVGIVVVVTCSTLGLLFGPKFMAIKTLNEQERRDRAVQERVEREGRVQTRMNFVADMSETAPSGNGTHRRGSVFRRISFVGGTVRRGSYENGDEDPSLCATGQALQARLELIQSENKELEHQNEELRTKVAKASNLLSRSL